MFVAVDLRQADLAVCRCVCHFLRGWVYCSSKRRGTCLASERIMIVLSTARRTTVYLANLRRGSDIFRYFSVRIIMIVRSDRTGGRFDSGAVHGSGDGAACASGFSARSGVVVCGCFRLRCV